MRDGARVNSALRDGSRLVVVAMLLLAVALFVPPIAFTASDERLTLTSLLEMAREQNPELQAADERARAIAERPIQESTLPDPSIGVRYHNEQFNQFTFGESNFSFLEPSFEQEVPYTGKLKLRGQVATREADRERVMRDKDGA